jgi:hypothetical protein
MNNITVMNRMDGLHLDRIKCYKLSVLDSSNDPAAPLFSYNFSSVAVSATYTILASNAVTGCSSVGAQSTGGYSTSSTGGIIVNSQAGAGTEAAPKPANTGSWDWMLARRRRLALAVDSSNSSSSPGLVQQLGTWLAARRQPDAAAAPASAAAKDSARQADDSSGSASVSGPGFRSNQMYRRRLA